MDAPSTGQADLHTHTYYSGFSKVFFMPYPESITPPETMVDAAVKKGLDVLCITDHNVIEGAMRAERYVRENGLEIEVVVGEEVSTADGEVLGLFFTGTHFQWAFSGRNHRLHPQPGWSGCGATSF